MSRERIIAPTVEYRPAAGFTRSANVPASAFGGGQGLAEVGQQLMGVALQMKQEDDTAKIQTADTDDSE